MASSTSTEATALDKDLNTPPETDVSTGVATPKAVESEKVEEVVPKKKAKPKAAVKKVDKQEPIWKDKKKKRKAKKVKEIVSSSDESSDSDSDEESSDSSDDSDSSEEEKESRRQKKRRAKRKEKGKSQKSTRKGRNSRREDSSDSDDSSTEAGSDAETVSTDAEDETPSTDSDGNSIELAELRQIIQLQQQQISQLQYPGIAHPPPATVYPASTLAPTYSRTRTSDSRHAANLRARGLDANGRRLEDDSKSKRSRKKDKEKGKAASKLDFKRVDQLWDTKTHQYKLSDTAEDEDASTYDQYLFNVKRTFDWEGQYRATVVDIKSKLLKEALSELLDGIRGVSLAEETPTFDPNFLFLYLEDLREKNKALRKSIKTEKMKRKARKRNELKVKHVKVLLKYLDADYADTMKTLYPMLESGLITFDLLWALYKPGTIAYATTYGATEHPRAFKVEYAEKCCSFTKGDWYCIEGQYLEYDGKTWGLGEMEEDVPAFKGARKISSLACYPLKYHKNEVKLRKELIERGKKFVSLQGVQYKSHEGMAYYKRRRQIIKVNINGRVMVDPAIHRRINPNYQISTVKAKEMDEISLDGGDEEDCDCSASSEDEADGQGNRPAGLGDEEVKTKIIRKIVLDKKKRPKLIEVEVDADGAEVREEKLSEVPSKKDATKEDDKKEIPVFTDEEYLIASPVVLGFAFAEKLWLEFTVSGIKDIVWNEGAYESLVLEGNTKDIVKALVESHKHHPAQSIDDVIQGKGKGLVAVLHGPPGTGKTLTAEGISELLKCPLYMVSAGELGMNPSSLEGELQKILDIAHAWGAVLLLDEADVFLEMRTVHDLQRNALVSIFLRLLEYFQGILFLTTNRVETFDDAFQSRIHIALRYGALSLKAKKAVFKMFIVKARELDKVTHANKTEAEKASSEKAASEKPKSTTTSVISEGSTEVIRSPSPTTAARDFTDADYNTLARYDLNGRQIKNTVRTAQALAVNKGEVLAMSHLRKVLDVAVSFDRDLKGGTGYEDAMRSYT